MVRGICRNGLATAWLLTWLALASSAAYGQDTAGALRACVTVPDLGSLLAEVGGDKVTVTVFAKPTEDPHYVEPKPSFIKAASRCGVYVEVGMDLEAGWAPLLLENSRNARIQPGALGYVDASAVIVRLEVPTGMVSRLMGDVHPSGNPHYLLDPLNGLRVARLLRDRLSQLRPSEKAYFEARYAQFAKNLAGALVGPELVEVYGVEGAEKLALLYERGKLDAFLARQGQASLLGGWLGMMRAHQGTPVVDDHNMWPYFARRFGIRVVGHMEPKPGIPPSTRHLRDLANLMKADDVQVVITAAYYDRRHADFLTGATGASSVTLAHQVGATPGAQDYLSMVDHNVRQLAAAMAG